MIRFVRLRAKIYRRRNEDKKSKRDKTKETKNVCRKNIKFEN